MPIVYVDLLAAEQKLVAEWTARAMVAEAQLVECAATLATTQEELRQCRGKNRRLRDQLDALATP